MDKKSIIGIVIIIVLIIVLGIIIGLYMKEKTPNSSNMRMPRRISNGRKQI